MSEKQEYEFMNKILLNEATTDQLLEELGLRSESVVCAYVNPTSKDDEHFTTYTSGSYILMWGLVKSLESKMQYHDYMAFKDEYDDEPDNFFKE